MFIIPTQFPAVTIITISVFPNLMKCPKCGFDNPEGTLFCEECDWRTDQIYRPEKKRNPLAFAGVACLLGILSLATCLTVSGAAGAGLGAIGMVLGGYSVNLPRYIAGSNKALCMSLAGLGIALSVIGFLFGLVELVG